MGFLTSLFGGPDNPIWTVGLSLAVVLVLIVIGVWLLKIAFRASNKVARGRNRRIGVIDTAPVDQRRQLILVRRDDVEHLLLIGGAQDVVVESGIPVPAAQPARPARRPEYRPQSEPPLRTQRVRSAPAPAPQPEAHEPAEVVAEPRPEPTASPLDRLRELGRPTADRPPASQRYSGLLRPVTRQESVGFPEFEENHDFPAPDSVTNGRAVSAEEAEYGDEEPQGGDDEYSDQPPRRDEAGSGY